MISEIPFVPNTKRGHWAKPNDFIYSSIALVFRMDFLHLSWFFTLEKYATSDHDIILIYILALVIYNIPLMILHSYLGQFSSSSYVSAFRLVPIFKCLGFVSLAINFCTIMFLSMFAIVPLVYMFASMQPTLPWSCEGFKKWPTNFTIASGVNLCNFQNASDAELNVDFDYKRIPSALYLKLLFNDSTLFLYHKADLTMSWQLCLCSMGFWCFVAFIIYRFFETEKMGRLIRYGVLIFISLLVVCLIRFSFLPGAEKAYSKMFMPSCNHYIRDPTLIPIYGLAAFGPGWGLLITLSSFNKFKTDIQKSSWIIGVGQMFVMVALHLLSEITEKYHKEFTKNRFSPNFELFPKIYLLSGSVMASMEWPNFWCILFFLMFSLGALVLTIIQLFSILTTIYDEFISLRIYKTEISLVITFFIALCSQYFISSHILSDHIVINTNVSLIQNGFNLLLIVAILWIYGPSRFQRDFEFLTNKRLSNWYIFVLNILVPPLILLALLISLLLSVLELFAFNPKIFFISIPTILFSLIFIPLYAIYSISQRVGPCSKRFISCFRPNSWYPVDAEELQRYEMLTTSARLMRHF